MLFGAATFFGGDPAIHGWAMATAAVVAASCALVGTLLVVRRMSLLGDAIGHAVLPGIAIAVLAGGRPGGLFVFVGAVAAALLTVWLIQGLRAAGGLAEDAGAGVVFTTLFAIGVVIISAAPAGTHIDPACVLAGDLTFIPFDTVTIADRAVPRAFLAATLSFAVLAAAAVATWKLQVFTAFDPAAARAAGVPVAAITAGLLAATAVATVASFDVVGAVLVVALLVVPAAAAELLAHRLHVMALIAMALAVVGACIGYLAAWHFNTNAAGMIAVVLGLEYIAAAILAPDDGVFARAFGRLRLAWRVAREDRLAGVWREEESAARGRSAVAAPSLLERCAAEWLRIDGSLVRDGGTWRLSPRGRRDAETVVRSHRLWEAWLGRHADLPLDHLHPPAEWVEHHLGAAMRRRIEVETGWRQSDPHGREIPPEA
ncbi:MAG: metal ABC transporter permease [Planctomycetia bacterium]|nr:metal ABC transporter permease [Planctomycetia bacterium]